MLIICAVRRKRCVTKINESRSFVKITIFSQDKVKLVCKNIHRIPAAGS